VSFDEFYDFHVEFRGLTVGSGGELELKKTSSKRIKMLWRGAQF
jgi:hypothetical protein